MAQLGYVFVDRALLSLALTHRSWCSEHAGYPSNERLEFLGDSVLGLAVTHCIYHTYPDMPEGELAKLRATVVSAATLSEIAADLDLGVIVRLGKGEDSSGGREKGSILADALEAVVGAVYLDGGWDAVHPFVAQLMGERIVDAVEAGPGGHDHKTQLQELVARQFDDLPAYDLTDEGPDHDKRFYADVRIGGTVYGHGEGRSKKQAEQEAAQAALASLVAFEASSDELDLESGATPLRRLHSGNVDA